MMTQGPAQAYDLADSIGNLNPGTYADFIILDPHFNSLSQLRIKQLNNASDILFALSLIGDDRAIEATYIAGNQQKISMEKSHVLA
jgi:guanine deaminase